MSSDFPPALDWLQTRRGQGVPTVAVLAGPTGLGLRAWRGWATTRGRPVGTASDTGLTALADAWVRCAGDPAEQARAWLAATAGPTADVGRMTRYDLDQLWRALSTDPAAPTARAAYRILADLISGTPTNPAALARELAAAGGPVAVVRGLTGLYPEPRWPALLVVEPEDATSSAAWLAAAVAALEPVVAAEPRLPVAVTVRADGPDQLVAARPDSRAAALVREGLVAVRGMTGTELEVRLRASGVEPPTSTVSHLTAAGLAAEVAEAFVEAAVAVRHPTPADAASDFRSIHERFLFEVLESLPATAGLFRPNAELPFRHGPRAGEADLLAERPRVAVEVDGALYHLTQDQYRRDRRKDDLYQRHGYLVLRFLAEDVVTDLEGILATIVDAVSTRLPR